MSALQWALLVVGAAAVIAVYWYSRREARSLRNWEPPAARGASPKLPGKDQLDMFKSGAGGAEFDEFGVGKPRRVAPQLNPGESRSLFPETAPARGEPEPPKKVFEEKLVTLLIAEREGTAIFGPKIHQALTEQNLVFGDRKIYHRMEGGQPVFSVASLIKPGTLDPAEAQGFSTPGLTVFMVLPGPSRPQPALQNMIVTARALAVQLNAEVFDANRQPFTAESQRVLQAEVDTWARRNGL
ncbi:MAG TPA: cell division protein ZipA C-terminal FtsZ-binding domain-containing protein [Solimonas sp.]|nr:cell division protein ZipA C-terminal FtsZ-binding domain-containing protein [Solimonas sp.]